MKMLDLQLHEETVPVMHFVRLLLTHENNYSFGAIAEFPFSLLKIEVLKSGLN